MGKAVLRLCSLLMMLVCFADMLKGYDRYALSGTPVLWSNTLCLKGTSS